MVSNCYSLTVIEWKQDPERLCCHFSHSKIAKLHNGGLTLHSKTLQNVALCHKKGLRLKYYIKNRPKIVWPFLEPFVIHEPAWNIRRQKTFRSFFKLTFYCILTNETTFPLSYWTKAKFIKISLLDLDYQRNSGLPFFPKSQGGWQKLWCNCTTAEICFNVYIMCNMEMLNVQIGKLTWPGLPTNVIAI